MRKGGLFKGGQGCCHLKLRDTTSVGNPKTDVHLGRLTKYLRMIGLDVSYKKNFNDDEIVQLSLKERRAILTRDRGILKRNEVTHGYWVRNTKVEEQVMEILERFDLKNQI